MEFKSIVGSQHILEPIGYNQVRKKRRYDVRYVVRSIQEQFLIHSLASDFRGTCLFVPKPIRLEPPAYIMDMLYSFEILQPHKYKDTPQLFEDLIHFKNYMYIRGYFAAGFTILQHTAIPVFAIVDFSQFGTIDSNFVMFPKLSYKYTIFEAETSFGLIGHDIVTNSFKKKHELAKSPKIAPSVEICPINISELELTPICEQYEYELTELPTTNIITIERTFSDSVFNADDKYWDKIDPLITHLNT
jgi:hypothetical protein